MLQDTHLDKILFLDIETVPIYGAYSKVPDDVRIFWDKKASSLIKTEDDTPESIYERAGIYAEFGKIICISVGFLAPSAGGRMQLRIKSFYGHDEQQLLGEFLELISQHYDDGRHLLCAHNGKEFDFPYLARRILISGLTLPALLDIAGKKPWEIAHLDTMVLWKFGDFKSYTSLALLASVFNIPTPKNDMDGSDVARVYWEEKDLDRIVEYCQKDVLTIAQLILKFKGESLIEQDDILIPELKVMHSEED